jgi:hypothetical protein
MAGLKDQRYYKGELLLIFIENSYLLKRGNIGKIFAIPARPSHLWE